MDNHKILTLTETCTGCFACANACPKDAISLLPNYEGFYFPTIDQDKCINCGLCDRICPQISSGVSTYHAQKAYYGWSVDDTIRKASSSGGVFYHLASSVLKEGGIVFGASFNYDGYLRLECHSTNEVELKELMRSKYVQNYIGYAFRKIKSELNNGNKILFCGTPCQIAGLKSYLNKEYENLLCVDFICHGVPSMDLLLKHLEYLDIKEVVDINFRPKNRSWVDDFEIRYKGSGNNKKIRLRRIPWEFDEYFCTFETYKNIRRSCRNCSFCNGERAADITIADFWGIKKYKPEIWDPRGQSLILVNTQKGDVVVNTMIGSNDMYIESLPLKYAQYVYDHNRRATESPYQNKERDEFLRDVYAIGYNDSIIKYGYKKPVSQVVRYKIICFGRKLKGLLK